MAVLKEHRKTSKNINCKNRDIVEKVNNWTNHYSPYCREFYQCNAKHIINTRIPKKRYLSPCKQDVSEGKYSSYHSKIRFIQNSNKRKLKSILVDLQKETKYSESLDKNIHNSLITSEEKNVLAAFMKNMNGDYELIPKNIDKHKHVNKRDLKHCKHSQSDLSPWLSFKTKQRQREKKITADTKHNFYINLDSNTKLIVRNKSSDISTKFKKSFNSNIDKNYDNYSKMIYERVYTQNNVAEINAGFTRLINRNDCKKINNYKTCVKSRKPGNASDTSHAYKLKTTEANYNVIQNEVKSLFFCDNIQESIDSKSISNKSSYTTFNSHSEHNKMNCKVNAENVDVSAIEVNTKKNKSVSDFKKSSFLSGVKEKVLKSMKLLKTIGKYSRKTLEILKEKKKFYNRKMNVKSSEESCICKGNKLRIFFMAIRSLFTEAYHENYKDESGDYDEAEQIRRKL